MSIKYKENDFKIAIITPGFLPVPAVNGGAIETLITYLIENNEVSGKGKIDVYTIKDNKLNNIRYKNTDIIQVRVTIYEKIKARLLYYFNKVIFKREEYHIAFGNILVKKYLRSGYDYILVENNMTIYADIYNKTNNKNNLIFHLHNDVGSKSKPKSLCQLINNTAVDIFVVSNYIKDRFDELCKSKRAKVLYNCLDLNSFNRDSLNKGNYLREKYNLHENDIVFMYSGRITEEKGIKELILAFKRLKNYDNIKLLIVGKNWFCSNKEDAFTRELNELTIDIKDKVIFTGYISFSDINEVYGISNVVVIPSKCEEAFCMVALEAMAMELPVIATNSGGMVEILSNKCAIIVNKEKDMETSLFEAMSSLIKDKNRRIDMGKQGYIRAKKYAEFNSNNYYNNFINKLLE
ncbi:glycosyltransferase family 4 protein [Clostridium perfringens]|uniref:glycosyltransferase family 4 protein n=1 Tax=Clostridium perfringens TaxID=1502 RepID=UPI0024437D12|nr:glycosyltransferase family 4 protein [Clostridium perfringens]MDG6885048.1 Spore coat protein SA [Clostridium perfringens]